MEVKVLAVRGDPVLETLVADWLRAEHNVLVQVVPHDAADVVGTLARFRPDLMVADEVALCFVSEILRNYPGTSVLTLSGHFPGVVLYEARPRHKAARRAIRRLRERRLSAAGHAERVAA
jgi:chemotaxis response regulator CheB